MSAESVGSPTLAFATLRRVARLACLAIVPALIALGLVGYFMVRGIAGADFKGGITAGSSRLLDGEPPYDSAYVSRILRESARGRDAAPIETPAYPPHVLVAALPLVPLGQRLAGVLAMIAAGIALVLALRVIGIADWRCYGALALTPVTLQGVLLANPTIFLVPAVALVWRWRRSGLRVALVLGGALSLKPLLLPALVWLVLTRRWRAALGSLAVCAGLLALGFVSIGSDPLAYWNLSSDLVAAQRHTALSVIAVGSRVGLSLLAALAMMGGVVVAATAIALARWRLARDERELFAATIAISLLASPLVHMHYLALLVIPLGLMRPRFGAAWLVGIPFWLMIDGGGPAPLAAFVVYAALMVVAVTRPRGPGVGSDPTQLVAERA